MSVLPPSPYGSRFPTRHASRTSSRLRLILALSLAMLAGACHRATASEVGEANRAGAFPTAEMQAARRASDVSPGVVARSATGTPMREAPVAGVPQQAVSQKQR